MYQMCTDFMIAEITARCSCHRARRSKSRSHRGLQHFPTQQNKPHFLVLSTMSRSSCSIKTLRDLTTEGGLKSLLQSHHGREDVLITDVGPFSGTGLINAGFQSDIKKATVKYRVRHLWSIQSFVILTTFCWETLHSGRPKAEYVILEKPYVAITRISYMSSCAITLQGGPSASGKIYVDIKFKVPSLA